MRQIQIIAHDMRSTHNVGSLLRTAEGLGVEKVYLTGYTPYPSIKNDNRLPHISKKQDQQIQKTALNAQNSIEWEYVEDIEKVLTRLREDGFLIIALEQTEKSVDLHKFEPSNKVALLLGTEVTGIPKNIIDLTDTQVVIPMFGKKESFNVVQAAAMAIYQLRFY